MRPTLNSRPPQSTPHHGEHLLLDFRLLIFIQVLLGNVILRDLMGSDFSLIGAGGFNATDHIGLERIAFLEQLGDAF